MMVDVLVIGAGLSGLRCAGLLAASGASVVVLEARSRVGGRAYSVGGTDLGGSWLWDTDKRAQALGRAAGARPVPQDLDGEAYACRGGAAQRLGNQGAGMAPCGPGATRWYGGYGGIAQTLAAPLDVKLGARVRRLAADNNGGGVTVTYDSSDDTSSQIVAKRVVVAAPPGMWAGLDFAPPLPAKRVAKAARTATWCGDWYKVAAVFRTAFWRAEGASGVVQSDGPAQIWWEGGDSVLVGLGVGGHTAALDGADAPALRRTVVEALAPAFGAKRVSEELVDVHAKAWIADDLTYNPGGDQREFGHPHLREPHGAIHFAGTESEDEYGHVEGALKAAERAAAEVTAALGL